MFALAHAFGCLPHEVLGLDVRDYLFAVSCFEAHQEAQRQVGQREKHRRLRLGA